MCEIYCKDSLDRFGDDLCQQLLSYLSLEDNFRFECISKQWRRVVLKSQTVLTIDGISGGRLFQRKRIFKTIMKKCANISTIYSLFYDLKDSTIDLYIKHFSHLRHISINFSAISVQSIDKFFTKFGPQLKTLKIWKINESVDKKSIEKWLEMCVNLQSFDFYYQFTRSQALQYVTESRVPFKRFISIAVHLRSVADMQALDAFADKYGHQMKTFVLEIGWIGEAFISDAINQVMDCLSRMRALISLRLDLKHISSEDLIPLLTTIGINCLQIKSLSITVKDWTPELVHTISESFKQLQRLAIDGNFIPGLTLTGSLFAPFKPITHLTLNFGNFHLKINIKDIFFANIDHNLPNLQYLFVKYVNMSDESLISLSGLRQIRSITLTADTERWKQNIVDNCVNKVTKNCPKIVFLKFNTRKFI